MSQTNIQEPGARPAAKKVVDLYPLSPSQQGMLLQALATPNPALFVEQVQLRDYKVRIVDGSEATNAVTRVLVVSSDGTRSWGTVGVSGNIIEASWLALVDGLDVFLQRQWQG